MSENFSWLMYLIFGALLFVVVGIPTISLEMRSTAEVNKFNKSFVSAGSYPIDVESDMNKITGVQLMGIISNIAGSSVTGTMVENSRTYTNVPLSSQKETNSILYIDGILIDQTTSTKSINFSSVPANSYKLSYGRDNVTGKIIIYANTM